MKITKFIFFKIVLFSGVAMYTILLLFVLFGSNTSSPDISDAILVLGHGNDEDDRPNEWLTARLDTALYLYNAGYADYIIVSGGIGPSSELAIAYIMKRYLTDSGVSYESIIMEYNANTTYQNFKYTYELMSVYGFETLLVVTNNFHVYRSSLIASLYFDAGDHIFVAAPVDMSIGLVLAYLREPISIVYNFVLILISQ